MDSISTSYDIFLGLAKSQPQWGEHMVAMLVSGLQEKHGICLDLTDHSIPTGPNPLYHRDD